MNELDTLSSPLATTSESSNTSKAHDAPSASATSGPGAHATGQPLSPRQVDSADASAPEDASASAPSSSDSAPSASSSSPDAALARHPSYWFLGAVSLLTMAADLGSKTWAERRLERPENYFHPLELIPGNLDFVLAKNRGGAWGLFQDTSESIRRPFFLLVSAAAITFIVTLYRRLGPNQRALRWGLPLVLGGALGNLIDRVRYSYVIDFIHMHLRWGGHDHHWPTYNVADIAICVGVGLMALDMFGSHRSPRDTHHAT